jgi:hypothetical protein
MHHTIISHGEYAEEDAPPPPYEISFGRDAMTTTLQGSSRFPQRQSPFFFFSGKVLRSFYPQTMVDLA